jgi:hypothetical protein
MRVDSGWNEWDMEIYGSRYVKVRLTTMSEHHDGRGMLTRVRVELLPSTFCTVITFAGLILTGLMFIYLEWPFSRPAILIPMLLWTMYLVNKSRVAGPVLSLIDEAAEKVGFDPVPAPKPVEMKQPAAEDVDLDEKSPSIA